MLENQNIAEIDYFENAKIKDIEWFISPYGVRWYLELYIKKVVFKGSLKIVCNFFQIFFYLNFVIYDYLFVFWLIIFQEN